MRTNLLLLIGAAVLALAMMAFAPNPQDSGVEGHEIVTATPQGTPSASESPNESTGADALRSVDPEAGSKYCYVCSRSGSSGACKSKGYCCTSASSGSKARKECASAGCNVGSAVNPNSTKKHCSP